MSRINTNVQAMLAQRVLAMQNNNLSTSLERLSTGLRINRGKDDPSGLIASENLRAEISGINAAMGNAQRAEQVVNVAEGALQEISNMLVELQGLVGSTANDAGVSKEEKEANQLQIDSILQAIDRIANTTSFQGTKLLNGNYDYQVEGVDTSELNMIQVNSARMSSGNPIAVDVDVQQAASNGTLFLSTATDSLTIELSGNEGVQQFTFAQGSTLADMASAINTFEDALGVTATVDGTQVRIDSVGFGQDAFVNVKTLDGDNVVYDSDGVADTDGMLKEYGGDAQVSINGIQAVTSGLEARVATDGFDISVTLGSINSVDGSSSFSISGGGADFNLSPSVSLAGKVSLAFQNVSSGNLGHTWTSSGELTSLTDLKSGGASNVVNGDLARAQSVVDSAVKEIATMRGRLGAFQKNTIQTAMNSLSIALENTAAAESSIRDTDFAFETAALTRQQILSQAATQALLLAKSQPQSVLALLA
ncbi:MAG: flagellin [Phycisphaerae bacterium]|nr:flagellin [Phycisphaerae bacterium]